MNNLSNEWKLKEIEKDKHFKNAEVAFNTLE